MKKKSLIFLVAVALLALVILCVFMTQGSETEEPENTTQPTQQTTQTAETLPEVLFENRMFTFTASQFREWFRKTLPVGYVFADQMVNNPDRDNCLQLDISGIHGEDTGMAVLLQVQDPEEPFCRMALVAEMDHPADFSVLVSWYVETFLVSVGEQEQKNAVASFTELYQSGTDDYRLFSAEDQSALMVWEEENAEGLYYVMVGVG